MGTQSENVRKKPAATVAATGLVFELEKAAVSGQRVLFEVCQRVLKEQSIALTPVLFSRFLMDGGLARGLARLSVFAKGKTLAAETLAGLIQDQYRQTLAKPSVALNPAFGSLLADAAKHGMRAGALSSLPGEAAEQLLDRLGLKDRVVLHAVSKPEAAGLTPDCWLAVGKGIAVPARRCVALATGAVACRTALEAGMRCVVASDAFSAHQDFGGADLVVDDLDAVRIKDIQALLSACTFR